MGDAVCRFECAFHMPGAMGCRLTAAKEYASIPQGLAQQRVGLRWFGRVRTVGHAAGPGLGGPVLKEQVAALRGHAIQLGQLAVDQQGQAAPELVALCGVQGDEAAEGAGLRMGIEAVSAAVKHLGQHGLWVAHKGVAGLACCAPEGCDKGSDGLGLRGHPGRRVG